MEKVFEKLKFGMLMVILLLAFSLSAGEVKNAVERNEIDAKYQWRMDHVYASDAEWEKDFERINPLLDKFDSMKGTLSDSPQNLLNYLKLDEGVTILAVKLSEENPLNGDPENGDGESSHKNGKKKGCSGIPRQSQGGDAHVSSEQIKRAVCDITELHHPENQGQSA